MLIDSIPGTRQPFGVEVSPMSIRFELLRFLRACCVYLIHGIRHLSDIVYHPLPRKAIVEYGILAPGTWYVVSELPD